MTKLRNKFGRSSLSKKNKKSLEEEIKIIEGPQMSINGHHICSNLFVYHLCDKTIRVWPA